MDIEVRINWTPNQWRRFCGQADITPLVELASVMIDRMAMLVVDRRLDALTAEQDDIGTDARALSPAKPAASDGASER